MPEPETRTRRPKIATVERREARRPDRKGRQGASQAPGVPRHVHATGASQAPGAVSALHPPLVRGRMQRMGSTRTQTRRGNERCCLRCDGRANDDGMTPRCPAAAIKTPAGARAGRVAGVDPPLRGAPSPGVAEQSQPVLARHGGEIGGHRGHVIGYGAPVDDLLAVRWVGHSDKHAPFCPATTPPSFAASENRKRPSMARGGCVLKGPCRPNFNPPRKRNRDSPGSPWFDTEG